MSIAHITDPQVHRNRPSGSRAAVSHVSAIRTLPEIRPRPRGKAKTAAKSARPARPHDPHTPRDPDVVLRTRKRGGAGTAFLTAFLGLFVTGLAFGHFPQIGVFWDQFNTTLQSHNDDVVNGIMTAVPFLLGGLGIYILYRLVCWATSKTA